MKCLLIGLGNPGSNYTNTRHNVGFSCIDNIAKMYNFPEFRISSRLEASSGNILNFNITLIKPNTYMNNSGEPLPPIIKKLAPNRVIVIHDDIDLKFGDIRFKFAGGNAGHNGLKSLDAHIGKNYWRIRIGVGRPENPNISIADFVLGRFSREEQVIISKIIYDTSNNIMEYITRPDIDVG